MIAGPARAGLIRSLRWLAWPYEWGARLRAVAYWRGWLPTYRLPRPVISIGNLTVGGTGKTPVVIFAAECLLSQEKQVAVLSRGYRRQAAHEPLLVSDGERLLVGPEEAGDEPYLIARRCPRAVVAVGPDRYRLGQWVLARQAVDYFILDDGFQHLHLGRDLNVLLLDATDWAGMQALVPVGRLREPLSAAARADAVFVSRVDEPMAQKTAVWDAVRRASRSTPAPIAVTFKVDGFFHAVTGERQIVQEMAGRRVLVFSGIGNPDSFHALILRQGMTVAGTIVLRDHARYDEAVLRDIRRRAHRGAAELWITTEKDAVKVAAWLTPEDPCWVVRISADIPGGCDVWKELLSRDLGGRQGKARG